MCSTSSPSCFLIAVGWPLRCRYWLDRHVQHLVTKLLPHRAVVQGCAYNMWPAGDYEEDEFLLKSWRLSCSSAEFAKLLDRRCCGGHRHREIAGDQTAESAYYPQELAAQIHRAARCILLGQRSGSLQQQNKEGAKATTVPRRA